MPLFYIPEIDKSELLLPEVESHHLFKVLRSKPGDELELTDGKGLRCRAVILELNKAHVKVEIRERLEEIKDRDYSLHIGIAPTKSSERFEWFLEKATEIGVDEITPLTMKNSERQKIRPERLEKVMISAMKQSLKYYKPKLNPLCRLNDFLSHKQTNCQLFIAYCGDTDKSLFKEVYNAGEDALVLIGPEGDFTSGEVNQAIAENYHPVSFGKTRLRTETAGLVACQSVYLLNQ